MSPDFAKKLAEAQALQARRGQGEPGLASPASPPNSQEFGSFIVVNVPDALQFRDIQVAQADVRVAAADSDSDAGGGTIPLFEIKASKAKT